MRSRTRTLHGARQPVAGDLQTAASIVRQFAVKYLDEFPPMETALNGIVLFLFSFFFFAVAFIDVTRYIR